MSVQKIIIRSTKLSASPCPIAEDERKEFCFLLDHLSASGAIPNGSSFRETRESLLMLRECYRLESDGDIVGSKVLLETIVMRPAIGSPFYKLAKRESSKVRPPSPGLFRAFELSSRVLPSKVRLETFEPAYNDEKAAYLGDRRRFKTAFQRGWLVFWFAIHVGWMIPQCFWGILSDKVKRVIVGVLPEVFRRILGG
jgi:hypothetical protein